MGTARLNIASYGDSTPKNSPVEITKRRPGEVPATGPKLVRKAKINCRGVSFNPTSEVETADDADYADKQKLGGETGRMSPKPAP